MATKLFLRDTQTHPVTDSGDGTLYDMVTTAGATTAGGVVNLVTGGVNIQWTLTAGGSTIAWVSGRVPTGGFTLTTTDIDILAKESVMTANAGGRFHVYKYNSGVVTELGGSPFDDGVEFGTAMGEMTWIGNVTDTALLEDERILVRVYATSAGGTMGAGSGTLNFNGTAGSSGGSFFNINENVTFKAEDTAGAPSTSIKMMPMQVQWAW